ncbi:MAG: winged helix-turn-helix domain-containing protein, partial [Oscillospiraceae bacterium]
AYNINKWSRKETPMNFDKIKAPTVRESFVRELENKILSGELKPGDKLPPAKELCEPMGVSLTVVNAGMSELANNGFVETIPRRGTYIADTRKGNAGTLSAIMRLTAASSARRSARCARRMR